MPVVIPASELDVLTRGPRSVFLFGLAYGFTSLSCNLPVFLAVFGASLTVNELAGGALMFSGYVAGMAVVLMAVAVGTTLLKGTVTDWFHCLLPYVQWIGAGQDGLPAALNAVKGLENGGLPRRDAGGLHRTGACQRKDDGGGGV